jgi:hypothetical protein
VLVSQHLSSCAISSSDVDFWCCSAQVFRGRGRRL